MRHTTPIFSKDFTLVAIGQVISLFGNQILRYALPLYLLNQTGSAALFGTIMAVSFLPMVLLFPVGGIIADRVNKRNIMVILDISTAMLVFLFYLLAGRIAIVPLMAVTLIILYGIQGAYQPAVKASVPVLVDTEYLMQANSVVDLISSLAGLAGPVIGGILLSVFGLGPILSISIGCFLVSAAMEMFIRIPYERRRTGGNILTTGMGDLKDSFHFLFRRRPILWKVSLVYASLGLFLTSLILIGVPVLITQHLGFAPDAASRLYGYAQGAIGAGAIVGGLFAGVLSKRLKATASPFLIIGCALSALIIGVALQARRGPMEIYAVLLTGCALLAALSTLFQIQIMSYIQMLTPKELIGKVISCVICVCMCTNPLGQFLYGFVFANIGGSAHVPFYVAALIMVGVGVVTRRLFCEIGDLIQIQTNGCHPKAATNHVGYTQRT